MSVSPQHSRMGWLESPGQVLSLGSGGLQNVAPLPVQSCILGRQAWDVSWLPPKLHHTKVSMWAMAKGCTAPTVPVSPWGRWEHPSVGRFGVLFLWSSGPEHVLEQVMKQQTSLLLIGSLGAAGNFLHILTPNDFCLVCQDSRGKPWLVANDILVLFPKCWAGGRNGQRFGRAVGAAPVHYVTTQGAFHLSA